MPMLTVELGRVDVHKVEDVTTGMYSVTPAASCTRLSNLRAVTY